MAVREYDRLRRSADDDRDRAKEAIKAIAGKRLLVRGLLLAGLASWRAGKWTMHRCCYGLLSNPTGRMTLALSALYILLLSGFTGEALLAGTGLWSAAVGTGATLYGARAYYSREKWEESTREVIKEAVPGHNERYPPEVSFSHHRFVPLQDGRWWPHYNFNFRVPAALRAANIYEVEGDIASALRVAKDTTYFLDWSQRQQTGRCYATAVPGLPEYIDYLTMWERLNDLPGGDEVGPWKVPLAISVGGVVIWDPRKIPHLLIAGVTGGGKSVAQRAVIAHALRFPEHWIVLGLDPKRVELSPMRPYENVEEVCTEPDEMADVLDHAAEIMEARYKEMEAAPGHCPHIHDLDPERPLVLLVVDEMAELTAQASGDEQEDYAKRMKMRMQLIAQKGRSAGIHMMAATQNPIITDGVITSTMRMNITGRLACGYMPPSSSRITLNESDEAANPAQGEVKGRAVWLADADMRRCQMVLTNWSHIYWTLGDHDQAIRAAAREGTELPAFCYEQYEQMGGEEST